MFPPICECRFTRITFLRALSHIHIKSDLVHSPRISGTIARLHCIPVKLARYYRNYAAANWQRYVHCVCRFNESRISCAVQSLSLTPARPRPSHAASGGTVGADDSDAESVKSYGSACSTASACEHASFALNGTTWSGRSRKYVVHCSNHNDSEQYLTPTQRAAKQVRKFQVIA